MSKIYPEIFDKKRQEIFYKLDNFKRIGYLAGGTALALQIKHRQSVDFDIFINKPVTNSLRLKVKEVFGLVDYYLNTSDQISFKTPENIHITFVWYYFKTVRPLVKTKSISLAAIEDIAADETNTIGRRAVWRDYVDFYFLLKERYITIEKVIKLAEKKFAGEFVSALFLEQLGYFEDLEVVPINFLKDKPTATEIKSFLQNEVNYYLKTVL